jgi:hypothetical protein
MKFVVDGPRQRTGALHDGSSSQAIGSLQTRVVAKHK